MVPNAPWISLPVSVGVEVSGAEARATGASARATPAGESFAICSTSFHFAGAPVAAGTGGLSRARIRPGAR
jgi:hypothetical protein